MLNAQATAAQVLMAVWGQHQSLNAVMAAPLDALPQGQRALAQELILGSLRHYSHLAAIWHSLLRAPKRPLPAAIDTLGVVGLYQLMHLALAPAIAVAQTVEAARCLRYEWACALLNGTLRGFLRQQEQQPKLEPKMTAAVRYSHPEWLLTRLRHAYPHTWERIVTANNTHPPLGLRVNRLRTTREAYAERLRAMDLTPVLPVGLTQALLLPRSLPLRDLPGFAQGEVSVQDVNAQFAAELLAPQSGEHILDACAAPGGKTLHLLEQQPNLTRLVALDSDARRLALLDASVVRLGLDAACLQVLAGDAALPPQWWDTRPFDAILLDAPCSATGVLRRHPDAKWLKREADIAVLARTQATLLAALWPLLRPGGRLLYVTCSLLPEENAQILAAFSNTHPEAQAVQLALPHGQAYPPGWQLLPDTGAGDGFFYALLRKSL